MSVTYSKAVQEGKIQQKAPTIILCVYVLRERQQKEKWRMLTVDESRRKICRVHCTEFAFLKFFMFEHFSN